MLQQLVNAISLGSIYALFALGLSLVWGVLGLLNLAHGALFMTAAYIAYRVATFVTVPLIVLLPVAMVAAGLLAVVLELVAFRSIRRGSRDEHEAGLAMLIASVGAEAVLVATVENLLTREVVHIPPEVFSVSVYEIAGVRVTNLTILIVTLALGLSIATALWVKRSYHGRALRGIAYDEQMCNLLGINSDRMASATMFVGGALAGGAGVLLALDFNAVFAHMGGGLLLKAFAVIIIGGVGSIVGAVAGGYLLALAETATVVGGYGSLRDAIAFGLVILVLIVRPEGILSRGKVERV